MMCTELRKKAIVNLTEEGYPPELADMLDYVDDAKLRADLQTAKRAFLTALLKSVPGQS